MVLEQTIEEVSNRYSLEIDNGFFCSPETEIKEKIMSVSKQEEPLSSEKTETIKTSFPQDELNHFKEIYPLLEQQNIAIDYDKLFSYLENNKSREQLYQEEQTSSEDNEKSSLMTNEEAREFIEREQATKVLRDGRITNYEDKERFFRWQLTHTSELMFFHRQSPIQTEEIDYAKMN